jgi:XTP/dITP diphosphohydrolase
VVKLLIATNNPGKILEYEELLADIPVEITFPAKEGLLLDVEETGDTFEENACLKALAYAQHSGMMTLADDSGLEVDALEGRPGVYSARYAGPGASDIDRYQKLLAALADTPVELRSARFRCVVALVQSDVCLEIADGVCEGTIGFEPRGENGFGYDPVFVVDGYGGRTMAELSADSKNSISHRGRAVETSLPLLARMLSHS